MVTLKNGPRTLETPVNPKQTTTATNESTKGLSSYEQLREQRIKENTERMKKLGIFDLSSKLKSEISSPKRSWRNSSERRTHRASPLRSSEPTRRSSRLQGSTPVRYSELPEKIVREKRQRFIGPLLEEGTRPEIYTEDQGKLLGSCESTWTLFVDGYGTDGKRIYDPINGKTCHQCRQKTLGYRTHCWKCNLVQGQFCGDCLYMRYGEHVLEANQNPNWICPPCRGICNCSICRHAKGWPATGQLYKKVVSLGFKSVAHYLLNTQSAQAKLSEVGTDDPVPVKRSLPFKDTKEVADKKDAINLDDVQHESPKTGFINKNGDALEKNESVNEHGFINKNGDALEKNESVNEHGVSNVTSEVAEEKDTLNQHESPKNGVLNQSGDVPEREKNEPVNEPVNEHGVSNVTSETEANQDSIARRLKQRRNKFDKHCTIQTQSIKAESAKTGTKDSISVKSPLREDSQYGSAKRRGKSVHVNKPNPDIISGRLRQRCNRA